GPRQRHRRLTELQQRERRAGRGPAFRAERRRRRSRAARCFGRFSEEAARAQRRQVLRGWLVDEPPSADQHLPDHEPDDARAARFDLRAVGATIGRTSAGGEYAATRADHQPQPQAMSSDGRRLELSPIGVVRSPFTEKMQAPRQPNTPQAAAGKVELFSGRDFEHALEDLNSFRYIWLIFWFDQSEGWRPKVLPPRSDKRRGLFA